MSGGGEPAVRWYRIHLCDPCIAGEGYECHTPGCALFLHAVDIPISVDPHGTCVLLDLGPDTLPATPLPPDSATEARSRKLAMMAGFLLDEQDPIFREWTNRAAILLGGMAGLQEPLLHRMLAHALKQTRDEGQRDERLAWATYMDIQAEKAPKAPGVYALYRELAEQFRRCP